MPFSFLDDEIVTFLEYACNHLLLYKVRPKSFKTTVIKQR
jgi:uncharacterized protein YutD